MSDMRMPVIDSRRIGLTVAATLARATPGARLVAVMNSSPKRGAGSAMCR